MTTPLSHRLSEAKSKLDLSTRQIRDAAARGGHEISVYTISQCLNGKHGNVTRKTIQALSFALQIPQSELERLAGLPEIHGHLNLDGQLAEHAGALTKVQADAVAEIIRQLAEGNRKAVGHHDDTSNKRAAGSAVTEDEIERHRRRRRPGWDFEHDSGLEDQRAALEDGEVGADEIPDDST